MRIIIVGDGKLGSMLARDLSREGHALTVIDTRSTVLQDTLNACDIMGVVGNGASIDTLVEAGVKNCDLLIAVTSSDEVNILSCTMAKRLGAKSTVARVRNTDYAKQLNMMHEVLDIDMFLNPERETALEIARNLRIPSALNVDFFARGRVELIELKVTEKSPLVGLRLMDLPSKFKTRFLICAVKRGDEVYIPSGTFCIENGDRIHVTASTQAINELLKILGLTQKIKDVMIVGGSRTAVYLYLQLIGMGMHITVVDKDDDRCQILSELMPKATVICGDGTNPELLQEEGLRSTDAFIAITDMDEQNIMISMYAGLHGTMKVFTKIDHILFPEVAQILGVESIVSPNRTSATLIERFVRATQNSLASAGIETLHKLVGGRVEALEFVVKRPAKYLHTPLKNLRTHENTLIACISRSGETIIPGGLDTIEINDRVVVVSAGLNVTDLKDIFL